jgi:alkanesulfonate monooxygenase SsuD/methylene tetrahydromethanopterin reductase-like flavin-dependent oxidoreductase (luciferase family)
MRFGLNLPNFGYLADIHTQVDLAVAAEEAGWDGFFLWDHVNFPGMGAHADPWITLGVVAAQTERLILGTAVTPVARRRPAKLAREVLTLDALSNGRFVFGAGNGIFADEFEHLGDEGKLRVRAEMLEEGLELLQALCTDEEVAYSGRHFQVKTPGFGPPQGGRKIPIWLGATWPTQRPVARAARFDGIIPILDPYTEIISPRQVRELATFIGERRESSDPFDIVVPQMGQTGDPDKDRARMDAYAEAGATWVLDATFPAAEPLEAVLARVRRGPPPSG